MSKETDLIDVARIIVAQEEAVLDGREYDALLGLRNLGQDTYKVYSDTGIELTVGRKDFENLLFQRFTSRLTEEGLSGLQRVVRCLDVNKDGGELDHGFHHFPLQDLADQGIENRRSVVLQCLFDKIGSDCVIPSVAWFIVNAIRLPFFESFARPSETCGEEFD